MKKRVKMILVILIILILIALIAIILVSFSMKKQEKSLSDLLPFLKGANIPEKGLDNSDNFLDDDRLNIGGGDSGDNVGGGGGGEGSEGGAEADFLNTTAPSSNCLNQQISYSIRNFNQFTEDNILNCSLVVTNLDEEITGGFGITFIFEDKDKNVVYSESVEKSILTKENEMFSKSFETSGKEITCKYKTIKIPKKEIC